MKISYRAIKEPNSLVRRLRYLSQILRLVEARPLNKDILAIKLRDWSSIHVEHLEKYRYMYCHRKFRPLSKTRL